MKPFVTAVLVCLSLLACGQTSLSGTYLPQGGGLGNGLVMEKLEFVSGDAVNLNMMQQKLRGTYKIDGKQLLIALNGQQMIFDIDSKGCLVGGGVVGKFCKG